MVDWIKCTSCKEELSPEQEVFTWGADCYRLCGDCAKMVHNFIIHIEDEIKNRRT